MKKLLVGLMIVVVCVVGVSKSDAVIKVVGGQAACDTTFSGCQAIPLKASLLCDGSAGNLDCPQWFAPDWADTTGLRFFGITNRTNPPRCVQSTNGGTTWGLCPSNPFVAVVDSIGAYMTVANDGSLIVAANQGANDCIIRRSTNYGTSWVTVFTDTTVGDRCDVAYGNPTPSTIRCARANAYCVMVGFRSGTFDYIPYFSTNSGASWTKGATFNLSSADAQLWFYLSSDASFGILIHGSTTFTTGRWAVKSGNVFVVTAVVPLPPGSSGSCRSVGPLIFNSGNSVICGPDNTLTTMYKRFDVSGTTPIFVADFPLQDAPTFANAPNYMAVGFNSSIGYIIGRNGANTKVLIHVTQDSFSSAVLLATITPASALIAGCCTGDVYLWNGKVYFTGGGTSTQAFLGVIQ